MTIEVVSWRKRDYVIVAIQKFYQNKQHNHAQTEVCKVCQGKHPTGLHGYKTRNKKFPNKAKADDKNKTAMKSNCAGMFQLILEKS